jgi:hypothetical protein
LFVFGDIGGGDAVETRTGPMDERVSDIFSMHTNQQMLLVITTLAGCKGPVGRRPTKEINNGFTTDGDQNKEARIASSLASLPSRSSTRYSGLLSPGQLFIDRT